MREPARRLPDFLIPGFKKSGSTTLYRWLQTHPDVFDPKVERAQSLVAALSALSIDPS